MEFELEFDKTDLSYDFHRHLDNCAQCREYPLNLCPAGHILLIEATSLIKPSNWLSNIESSIP